MSGNTRRIAWLLGTLLVAGLFIPLNVFSQERDSVTYDGVTYYLPQARDKIAIPKDVPETYTVKSGDTLWGIAGTLLKDPFLWPLIWENNMENVANPHLIYPDQTITLPKSSVVVPTQTAAAPPGASQEAASEQQAQQYPPLGEGEMTVSQYIKKSTFPLATASEREACGFITRRNIHLGRIVASELPLLQLSVGDFVYINVGENDNVKAGDIFTVFSYTRKVNEPGTNRYLGKLVQIKGRLKVLCAQSNSSTAIISKAFDSMYVDNYVMPFTPPKDADRPKRPKTEFCKPSSGELKATIVDVQSGGHGTSDGVLIGEHDIVYVNKGTGQGVQVGQYYAAYSNEKHYQGGLARVRHISIGELLIIRAEDETATGIVTKSSFPMTIGDRIDLIR